MKNLKKKQQNSKRLRSAVHCSVQALVKNLKAYYTYNRAV